eukprot:536046-Amphidinium_carterae.1
MAVLWGALEIATTSMSPIQLSSAPPNHGAHLCARNLSNGLYSRCAKTSNLVSSSFKRCIRKPLTFRVARFLRPPISPTKGDKKHPR